MEIVKERIKEKQADKVWFTTSKEIKFIPWAVAHTIHNRIGSPVYFSCNNIREGLKLQ